MRSDHEAWAREVLADPRTAVLDTETTGRRGYTCELSVYDGERFLIDTLVNPLAPIEPGAQRVHGLTAADLAAAPGFGQVWPALEGILATRRIIVWNADFDSAVIRRELARLAVTTPALDWEDAMRHYSDWQAGMDDARFVRLNGGHRAGEECKAVFGRLREMAGV
jgi:DNA polymerase III epsilon subunit-like protein